MATLISIFMALVLLHIGSAQESTFTLSAGLCPGTPDVDLTDSIKTYLRTMSNNITLPSIFVEDSVMGVDIEPAVLTGLGTLWTFKPYYPYCSEKESFVLVTAFAHEPLVAEMNWKSCTGVSGILGTKAKARQLRLIFRVLSAPGDAPHIELSKIHADRIEDAELYLTGAPEGLRSIVSHVGFLMQYHVEKIWNVIFRLDGRYLASGRH